MSKTHAHKLRLVPLFLLGCLYSILPQSLHAQKDTKINLLEEIDYRNSKSFFQDVKSRGFDGRLYVGYHLLTFENPTYFMHVKEKSLTPKGSLQVGMGYNSHPFYWDIDGWIGSFTVGEGHPLYDDKRAADNRSVINAGASIFLSLSPLPDFGKFSEYLRPYVGLGLSTTNLSVSDKSSTLYNDKTSEDAGRLSFITPMWKVGLHFSFGTVGVYGEYRQTLSPNTTYQHSAMALGLSLGY